jgi:hypothetical protein
MPEPSDLIDKARVLDVLREAGRPLTGATVNNYRHSRRAPHGWPQPVTYVGRTPFWSERAIRAYARSR